MNESESKRSIVNENSLQNSSADVSEDNITEQKDKEYKEPSVTKEVTSYFNIFKYRGNLLDRLDVTYELVWMGTPKDEYYNMLLDTLVDDNYHKVAPFSNDNIRQAVGKLMEEMEAEFERNINKITCDTSFKSPIQKKYVSTTNDYVYYESDKQVDTISDSNKQVDPSSNPKEDTKIIDRLRKLSVRPILFAPVVLEPSVIIQDLVTRFQKT